MSLSVNLECFRKFRLHVDRNERDDEMMIATCVSDVNDGRSECIRLENTVDSVLVTVDQNERMCEFL